MEGTDTVGTDLRSGHIPLLKVRFIRGEELTSDKNEVDTTVSPRFFLLVEPFCALRWGQGPNSASALMTGCLRQEDHSGPKELRAFDPLLRSHPGLFFHRLCKGLSEGVYEPLLTLFLPEAGGAFREVVPGRGCHQAGDLTPS